MKSFMKCVNIILFCVILFQRHLYSNGKTFLKPRAIQEDILLQKLPCLNNAEKGVFELEIIGTAFYQESTNSKDLAHYFFPEDKEVLVVKGPALNGAKDISSTWLAIGNNQGEFVEDFYSQISINPKHKKFGLNLEFSKRLEAISKNLSFSLFLPFVQVENNLKLSEFNKSTDLERLDLDIDNKFFAANAKEAFNHPLLYYSKIANKWQTQAGLADIKMQVNYLKKISDIVDLNINGFTLIPTGHRPNAEYLFEPIVGNGKHFGLGLGLDLNLKPYNNLIIAFIIEYRYLLESTNKRTFDITHNGKFSRYLDARTEGLGGFFNITDVANFSTLDCDVTPRSSFNGMLRFCYLCNNNINVEFGYNLWYKDSEKVRIKEEYPKDYAISGSDINNKNFTIKDYFYNATISKHSNSNTNPNFKPILKSDLNIDSVRMDSYCSHKFYFSLGFANTISSSKYKFNTGGSYEFGSSNNAIDNWMIFTQLSILI